MARWGLQGLLFGKSAVQFPSAHRLCNAAAYRVLMRNSRSSTDIEVKPAIAQLVEHLTVDVCRKQVVPGLIPGGRACKCAQQTRKAKAMSIAGAQSLRHRSAALLV